MRYRLVLKTEQGEQSLGLHDRPADAIEHLRLWWISNRVWDSHWMSEGFISISIVNEAYDEWMD